MEGEMQGLAAAAHGQQDGAVRASRISGFEDLAFGSLAGMAGKFVEYPFDTVKVRLQTSGSQVFSGTVDCLRQTWQNEGFRGFYRGLTSPLLGAMAENAIAFYAYNRIQSVIRAASPATPADAPLSLAQLLLSGALSGSICAIVITPVELVKCKLQVENVRGYGATPQAASQSAVRFSGPLSVVAHLLKTQGIAGLYRGIAPTIGRETVGVGFWFGTYELVCRQLLRMRAASDPGARASKEDLGPGAIILAGGCAGIGYNATSYPIDVVKSLIQTADVRAPGQQGAPGQQAAIARPGVLSTVRAVYTRGGIAAFYRGLGITLLRAFPANAAMFMTYEYFCRLAVGLRGRGARQPAHA
ncbi:mitochondrial ornithine carrier protein [Coemansia biformis]|uniref:Mitochondrial ornithine carrier protein n=1 Tax=Coemansia biformis TaxID=1286918 RepID=A0A9W7YFS0_9FUNG|nr:mitochondrial ornithine carrier protein [Coemansia biformis]